MMITKYGLGRALTVVLLSAGISACAIDYFTRSAFNDYNDVLRTRAERIEALLARCVPGPSVTASQASDASAASAAVANAATNLVDAVGGYKVDLPVANAQWNPFFDAQLQAYNAAVACGLASPHAIDPGGWSATWDDISS